MAERSAAPDNAPDKEAGVKRDWLNVNSAPGEQRFAEPQALSGEEAPRSPWRSVAKSLARHSGLLTQSIRSGFDRVAGGYKARIAPHLATMGPTLSRLEQDPRMRQVAARVRYVSGRSAAFGKRSGTWLLEHTRRLPWRYAFGGAGIALLVLGFGYFAYCLATIPYNGGLVIEPTASALLVQADDSKVFATRGVFKGDKLAASELPPNLAQAIVAIEDRRFYDHRGIDLKGLARALLRNTSAGGTREGGSTITQQLVRMLYLSQERTLKRKAQEAMLAIWLEAHLSKEEILTTYLNTAYFGAGVYGADAAAKRYFGKAAKDLTLSEAAMLAGLVRAPSQLAPHRNLSGAQGRAAQVLDAMVETRAISREQADDAKKHPAELRIPAETPEGANYFVDMVSNDVRRLIGTGPADVAARTTLDLNLQNIAESVIARRLDQEGAAKGVSQAALVALAPDGAVLAMVGGRDYGESQFNRAIQAKRQAGSIFKLFVYLTALRNGARPDTMMVDRPTQIGEWEPENYGGRYRGPVTLRTAFANSINTVAVQLGDSVGIPAVIETAKGLGIQSDLPNVPSLALGSAEVTLLEMTRAYAAVAFDAEKLDAYTIRSITSRDQTLYTRPQAPSAPQRNAAARAAMLDLLSSVVREGTGKGARISGFVGGKTGTTQENRDAWFIGFTPEMIVGVWLGNDDNTPMNNVTGGGLPASIWHDFMMQASRSRAGHQAIAAPQERRGTSAAGSAPASPPAQATTLRGTASVVDTATLELGGRTIKLLGVEGTNNTRSIRDFERFLRRGDIECQPEATPGVYRCALQGQDLSELVLFNGGGRASPDATANLLTAEEQARSARVGLWRR
ncbi:MAG: PBP1A family penicillin-binding protein [Beijerinckiaceae bacterium]